MADPTFLEKVARGLVRLANDSPSPVSAMAMVVLWVILDHSGSMNERCGRLTRLEAAQRAALALLRTLWNAGHRPHVGVIAFDDQATIVLPPTPSEGNRERIRAAIQSIAIAGGTDLKPPLIAVRDGLIPTAKTQVVLLTDGHGGDPIKVAGGLKAQGVIIETVGIAHDPSAVNESVLRKVASVVAGQVLYRFLTDPDALEAYFRDDIAGRLMKLN